ncbi:MAG: hypothetical protein JW699_08520 [Chitinispirillaceae bacterium]|nr:hypothetical protein [Chitinispirillaceae bacterium]
MKKVLALLSVGVAAAVMTGCGLSPTSAPVVTLDQIPDIAIPSSGSVYAYVTGNVEADTVISAISYSILTSTDQPVSASQISVTGPQPNGEEEIDFDDYPITITVYYASGVTQPGTYKLKISVTAGPSGPSADATFNFTVTGTPSTLTEKTITLGAQSAAQPSCLDADNMTPLSSTIGSEAQRALVDLIFSYSTVLEPDALAFTSPDSAQGSPYDSWASKAHTELKIVTATWSSITTQGDVNTLWGTGAGSSRIPIAQGDIVVIWTSGQAYKVVQVSSITGTGTSATVTLNGKY